MDTPKVSVILDNYNYADYLPKAIDSVLQQTYQNYELIVVDDGSNDDSCSIVEEYVVHNPAIRPIFKENGGQMSAFNAAFEKATGQIIAFLDSDDYWYPNKLDEIVRKHRDYRVVQHYLSNNGSGIYREVRTDVDWHTVLMRYGYLYNHSVCSSLSFDRELLLPLFPFSHPERMRYCADGILLMAALSMEKVGFIEKELGFYRIHGKNGFVGKTDFGQSARDILKSQHQYVNDQLHRCGYPLIPFSNHRYFAHLIDKMLRSDQLRSLSHVLLYGTESSGLYLSEVLEERGIEVAAYLDSSPVKQGKTFRGKMIYSPDALDGLKRTTILIASSAQRAIGARLDACGLRDGQDYYSLPI